jgi:hypothetical protein
LSRRVAPNARIVTALLERAMLRQQVGVFLVKRRLLYA